MRFSRERHCCTAASHWRLLSVESSASGVSGTSSSLSTPLSRPAVQAEYSGIPLMAAMAARRFCNLRARSSPVASGVGGGKPAIPRHRLPSGVCMDVCGSISVLRRRRAGVVGGELGGRTACPPPATSRPPPPLHSRPGTPRRHARKRQESGARGAAAATCIGPSSQTGGGPAAAGTPGGGLSSTDCAHAAGAAARSSPCSLVMSGVGGACIMATHSRLSGKLNLEPSSWLLTGSL
mmetsp:Transcript_89187/g.277287  ORF Transcript_89187/g.277287 Transcript_89187/m.277287 type:complete len:236 (+) Transcript_89187:76-783(+)